MGSKPIITKSGIGSFFGVIRAPLSFVLDKYDEEKQKTVRKSIWNNCIQQQEQPRNRRLLDIALLNFDENFIIGLPEIDKQHKLIMISYNTIVRDALQLRKSKDATARLTAKIKPIFQIIGEHFSGEEALMRAHKYPELLNHICQHDQFMCDSLSMLEVADERSIGFEQLIFFIGAWISGHILITDRYFCDFLKSQCPDDCDADISVDI